MNITNPTESVTTLEGLVATLQKTQFAREETIKILDIEISNKKQAVNSENYTISELLKQKSELTGAVAELSSQRDSLKAEIEVHTSEKNALVTEKTNLSASIESQTKDLNKKLQTITDASENLEADKSAYEAAVAKLVADKGVFDKEKSEHAERVAKLSAALK